MASSTSSSLFSQAVPAIPAHLVASPWAVYSSTAVASYFDLDPHNSTSTSSSPAGAVYSPFPTYALRPAFPPTTVASASASSSSGAIPANTFYDMDELPFDYFAYRGASSSSSSSSSLSPSPIRGRSPGDGRSPLPSTNATGTNSSAAAVTPSLLLYSPTPTLVVASFAGQLHSPAESTASTAIDSPSSSSSSSSTFSSPSTPPTSFHRQEFTLRLPEGGLITRRRRSAEKQHDHDIASHSSSSSPDRFLRLSLSLPALAPPLESKDIVPIDHAIAAAEVVRRQQPRWVSRRQPIESSAGGLSSSSSPAGGSRRRRALISFGF